MRGLNCPGILSLAACLAGCATITTGTDQGIRVITELELTGAGCRLVDSKENVSYIPNTPGTAYISRGDGPLTITCQKEGYKSVSLQIEEGMADATLGNIILGGGIGLIFDAASGAAQRYPDEVVIWMEPAEWADTDSRDRWLKAKHAYEQALEKTLQSKGRDAKDAVDF